MTKKPTAAQWRLIEHMRNGWMLWEYEPGAWCIYREAGATIFMGDNVRGATVRVLIRSLWVGPFENGKNRINLWCLTSQGKAVT